MKKTSLYLVAALAAINVGQARANYLGESLGNGIVIDQDTINALNDQECRDYVGRRVQAASNPADRATLRAYEQAKRKIENYRSRKRDLKDSLGMFNFRARMGWGPDIGFGPTAQTELAGVIAKKLADVRTTAIMVEGALAAVLAALNGKVLEADTAVTGAVIAANDSINDTRANQTAHTELVAEVEQEIERLDGLTSKYQRALDRIAFKVKEIEGRRETKLNAAVSRYCGFGQSIQVFSATEMGLMPSYTRTTPMFNVAPNRQYFPTGRLADRVMQDTSTARDQCIAAGKIWAQDVNRCFGYDERLPTFTGTTAPPRYSQPKRQKQSRCFEGTPERAGKTYSECMIGRGRDPK